MSTATSNAGLVQQLIDDGSLKSESIITAFKEVDRKIFFPPHLHAKLNIYANTPLREPCENSGFYHQSQPLIYGRVLERLMPINPGMSFLNVGSGTGYFSTLVSYFLGEGTSCQTHKYVNITLYFLYIFRSHIYFKK